MLRKRFLNINAARGVSAKYEALNNHPLSKVILVASSGIIGMG